MGRRGATKASAKPKAGAGGSSAASVATAAAAAMVNPGSLPDTLADVNVSYWAKVQGWVETIGLNAILKEMAEDEPMSLKDGAVVVPTLVSPATVALTVLMFNRQV